MIHNVKPTGRGESATKKRKPPRNPTSGKFDAGDPYTDPQLMDDLVRYVRAITVLEPVLSGTVLAYKQLGEESSAQMVSMAGLVLADLKQRALQSLAVDPESRTEAKKKRLDAQRLGNVPMAEVQRVQALANEWLAAVPVTPVQLAKASPAVLESIMKSVAPFLVEQGSPFSSLLIQGDPEGGR